MCINTKPVCGAVALQINCDTVINKVSSVNRNTWWDQHTTDISSQSILFTTHHVLWYIFYISSLYLTILISINPSQLVDHLHKSYKLSWCPHQVMTIIFSSFKQWPQHVHCMGQEPIRGQFNKMLFFFIHIDM